MKKLFLSLVAISAVTLGFAQKKSDEMAKFKAETINMGNLEQNKPETVTFVVTNISSEPLIIEQASPTCGCTIGDYTKSPIAPGKTGQITAKYNAAALGHFDKHLKVKFAGASDEKTITIQGDVLTAEEFAKLKESSKTNAATKDVAPVQSKSAKHAAKKTAKNNAAKTAAPVAKQ